MVSNTTLEPPRSPLQDDLEQPDQSNKRKLDNISTDDSGLELMLTGSMNSAVIGNKIPSGTEMLQ